MLRQSSSGALEPYRRSPNPHRCSYFSVHLLCFRDAPTVVTTSSANLAQAVLHAQGPASGCSVHRCAYGRGCEGEGDCDAQRSCFLQNLSQSLRAVPRAFLRRAMAAEDNEAGREDGTQDLPNDGMKDSCAIDARPTLRVRRSASPHLLGECLVRH